VRISASVGLPEEIMMKRLAVLLAIVAVVAVSLSLIWRVPYIYTLIGFAAWAFIGHVVTSDDDVKGGWSNPDGTLPFPWGQLIVKGLLLLALGALAIFFPVVCTWGGVR